MGYQLHAWVARQEVFTELGIESVPLTGGFALTTREGVAEKLAGRTAAFLAASFFGGCGEQDSEVHQGETVTKFGPSYDAIDQALKLIGVVRTEDHDEFDVLGLSRHRDNDWMPEEDIFAFEGESHDDS